MATSTRERMIEAGPQDAAGTEIITKPLEVWTPVVQGAQSWAHRCSLANSSLQQEWFGFIERRLQHDASLPHRFSACKAPDEAWRVYLEFLQTAADDYRKEYTELAKLGSSLANETLHVLQTTSAEVVSTAHLNERAR